MTDIIKPPNERTPSGAFSLPMDRQNLSSSPSSRNSRSNAAHRLPKQPPIVRRRLRIGQHIFLFVVTHSPRPERTYFMAVTIPIALRTAG